MAQIIVRGLEEEVKQRLKRRARRHGRSMEDEIRHILRDAAAQAERSAEGLGTTLVREFRTARFEFEIAELRGHPAQAVEFDP